MNSRFPLYAKILGWFFLNLLVLAAVFFVLFRGQFQFGVESLLANRARERIQPLGQIIAEELNLKPRSEWNSILKRFTDAYHVRFLLYHGEGMQLAGETMRLPPPVHARMTERRPLRGRDLRGGEPPPRDGGNPPPPQQENPLLRDGENFRQPGPLFDSPDSEAPLRGPREMRGSPPNPAPFVVRIQDSPRYWIGIRLPPINSTETPRGPLTLFVATDSLSAGGLLLDYSLWIWVGAGALVFSIVFWLPLVRSITRSIAQMKDATAQIAEGRFDVRLNEKRRDELGSLGGAINRMAARLAGFVTGQKRFLGDIAHELCSPIARMQMAVGILEERAEEKDKKYVADLREEVQEISSLVNELLSFSKASLNAGNIKLQTVSIRAAVEKAVRRDADKHPNLQIKIGETLKVTADPELLVRAVSNLLRNAIRHAGQSPVNISASATNNAVELIVADSGPGVPESEIPKLFDPFYRVDTSRTRETGGIGLGLSIVKTCVETCRGSVICRNRKPSGFEVVIRLPVAV